MAATNNSRANDLRVGSSLWLKLLTAVGLVFLLLPLPVLIVYSFNADRTVTHWSGFSLAWYGAALTNQQLWLSIRNSLFIALCSATVSTILGTLAALVLTKYRFRGRTLFQNLLYIPVVLPEIIFGLSLMILFIMIRLPLGFVSIICAHVTFQLAFVALIVLARLYRFNQHLEDASLDLGANRLQTFYYVIFPIIAPALFSAGMFAFMLSMDDFVITLFTSGAHSATLPLFIYSKVKYGVTPELNAVSTLLIVFTILGLAGAALLQKAMVISPLLKRVMACIGGAILLLLVTTSLMSRDQEVLNLYNYAGYICPGIITDFEKETGIKVNQSYYNSNEELFARMTMGASDYDLIVPSGFMVQNLIKLNMLAPIRVENIPNARFLDPAFCQVSFDPEGQYHIPYTYGSSGILYNSNVIKEPVVSWSILWDPQYKGRITMLDDMRETLFAGCKRAGVRLQDWNVADLERAYLALAEQKPLLLRYDSGMIESLLLSGASVLSHYWSGGAMRLQMQHPHIRFAIPREGVAMFIDSLCIPANARHRDNAERFINFLISPEQSARNMEDICYVMPNKTAIGLVKAEIRTMMENLVNADPTSLELIEDPGEYNKTMDSVWTRLRSQ